MGVGSDAVGNHVPLLLSVEGVVMILHRNEARPAIELCNALEAGELPGVHGGRADVAALAQLDEVVQRLHRLLRRRVGVVAVDDVQVDVVHLQALQAALQRIEQRLTTQAALQRRKRRLFHQSATGHALGGDEDVLPAEIGMREQLLQGEAEEGLTTAVTVGLGRVEEGDAGLEGLSDDGLALLLTLNEREHLLLVGLDVVEKHHAEANAADDGAGGPQADVLHAVLDTGRLVVVGRGIDRSRRHIEMRKTRGPALGGCAWGESGGGSSGHGGEVEQEGRRERSWTWT